MPGAHPSLKVLDPGRDPERIEEMYGKRSANVWKVIRDAQRVEEAGGPPPVAEVWELEAEIGPPDALRTSSVRLLEPGWLAEDPTALERLRRMYPAEQDAVAAVAEAGEVEVVRVWVEADPPGLSPLDLLRRMAQKGYGRPSTYAEHVEKMREWFGCDNGRVVLDDWGRARQEDLAGLPVVIDARFSAELENALARVERGELSAEEVLGRCVAMLGERGAPRSRSPSPETSTGSGGSCEAAEVPKASPPRDTPAPGRRGGLAAAGRCP